MVIAITAFGKTASSQCSNLFTYNTFPQGCGEFVSFVVNPVPVADSIVFGYGNGETFTTNGISAQSFYNGGLYEVEVTAYHNNGCESTSTQWITVGGLQVSLNEDTIVCQSDYVFDPVITGGSGNYIYDWWPTTGLDDPSLLNPTLSLNVEEQFYYLTVVDQVNGCQITDTIVVTRNDFLVETYSLCDGPVTIDLGPGASVYTWLSFTDTAGNNTPLSYPSTVQSIVVDEPGEYFMYADFPNCGALTSLVTVEACPTDCQNTFTYNLITGPCIIEEFAFFGAANSQVVEWHWDFGDGATSTAEYPNHAFDQGVFEVTLTTIDINGCEANSSQFFTANGGFGVVAIQDSVFCQSTGHLGATVYGGSTQYTYQWSPTTGLSDPTALIPQVSGVHEQVYTLTVTDQQTGCTAVDSTLITVQNPVFGTYSLCDGPVTIDLGSGALYYYWQYHTDTAGNTVNLNYPTTQQSITVSEPGEYLMYAQFEPCGALTSVVTVESCSNGCTSSFVSSLDAPVCASSVQFVATTSSPTDSITYYFGDGTSVTTNGISATNFYLTGVYIIEMVAYHTDGCVSQYSEILTVGGGMSVDIMPNGPVACAGNILLYTNITDGSGSYGYQWFANGVLSDPTSATPTLSTITEETEVTVYVTDAVTGCQVSDTVIYYPNLPIVETLELCTSQWLEAPAFAESYTWVFEDEFGNTTALPATQNAIVAANVGTYTCNAYSSGCDQVIHMFYVLPCSGGCTSFFTYNSFPSGCGAQFSFVPGFTPAIDSLVYYFGDGTILTDPIGTVVQHYFPNGSYVVNMVAYHVDGCISEMIETVVVDEGLEVDILNDGLACGGDVLLMSSVSGGSGGYMYEWFVDGLPFNGSTAQSPVIDAITSATEISLFVTDSNNSCASSDTIIIYPNVAINETIELCNGIVVLQVPANSQFYNWTFTNLLGNTTNLSADDNFLSVNQLGTYVCMSYTSGCLQVFHEFEVVECSTGVCFAQINSDLDYDGCGAWLDFSLSATPTIDSVIWELGNGQTIIDEGQGPVVYYASGTYIAFAEVFFTNGCVYTTSYGITLLTEVVAEIWEDTIACNGQMGIGVDVTGGGGQYEFEWSPAAMFDDPTDQYPLMTILESTTVTVTVVDTYTGCTVMDSVMIYANEPVNEVLELCQDSVTLILDPGSLIYQWTYTDQSGNTTQMLDFDGQNEVTVAGLGTYACFTYSSGCNTITHLFTVVDCAGNGDVWPGDANSDNVVTASDALWVGLAFAQTGPTRPAATNDWVGQPADDWIFNFSYNDVNLKHADCDGNGIINFDDTLAIDLNYGLTHNKTETELAGGEPELWVEAMPDTAGLEEAVNVSIYMAKSDLVVDSIHGLSFSIVWDETLTMPNDAQVNFAQSIFGTQGVDLLTFTKPFLSEGRVDIAITRMDGINLDGHGLLCQFRIVTIDNLSGIEYLPIGLENVTALTSSEDSIGFVLTDDVVVIDPTRTDVRENVMDQIQIYPNPTRGKVVVVNEGNQVQLQVMDSRGRIVTESIVAQNDRHELDLTGMESGMYHLRMSSQEGVHYSKLKLIK